MVTPRLGHAHRNTELSQSAGQDEVEGKRESQENDLFSYPLSRRVDRD